LLPVESEFTFTLEDVDEEWKADLIQQAWDLQVITKTQAKGMRQSSKVIWAEIKRAHSTVNDLNIDHSTLTWGTQILTLYQSTFSDASCLYFDGSCKFIFSDLLPTLEKTDPITLLHLFVEIWGTDEEVGTEGMELFNLPNLRIRGVHPKSPAAQATAFSAAAQMICENLKLPQEQRFQASESFPWFRSQGLKRAKLLEDDDISETELNHHEGENLGEWALILQKETGA
jgi:hypothetical protein